MTRPLSHRPLVLGFHPTARGFGWVVFEDPFKLVSHGVYESKGGSKNTRCLRKFRWLLSVFEPQVLVIETFDKASSMRSERIRKLCLKVVSSAAEADAEIDCLKRSSVQRVFAAVGAKTREEIAAAVAQQIPTLRIHLPKRRKQWDGEDKRLSVFSATALVFAHYENGAAALLDDLRNAA
jgi:hypothetical protein